MKRRLDLALALVHSPRVLFLDEPTTGLDPSSRADLWAEVARLAREDGVTVFLTTQYLEEADVLADRVGIIDAGHIVAEGTPESLKAEIGRPSVEATPVDRADRDAVADVLSHFGSRRPRAARRRRRAPAERRGPRRRSCARWTPPTCAWPTCSCTSRRWTTSSWPRPGRKLDAETDGARGGRGLMLLAAGVRRWRGARSCRRSASPRWSSRRSLFPLILMGINVGGLDAATNIPGFPPTDSYLDFAIAFPFIQGSLFASINAGSAVARDVETGFLNRLALTPMQRAALLLGNLSGVMVVALISSLIYLAVGFAAGLHFEAGLRRRARAARARRC